MIDKQEQSEYLIQYGQAYEHMTDATYIIELDGRVVFANSACMRTSGYSYDELVGLPISTVISQEVFEAASRKVLNGSGLPWEGEIVGFQKGGSQVPCELTVTPLKNQGNEIVGMIVFMVDKFDRYRVHQRRDMELRRVNEQLSLMMDRLPVVIYRYEDGYFLPTYVSSTRDLRASLLESYDFPFPGQTAAIQNFS